MTGEILASWFGSAIASSVIAVVVAKATAVRTLETKMAVLEERENNHYSELDKKIDTAIDEIRELRKEVRRS